jgi:transcriptional regulator with XRE-family HTH domain
MMFLEKVEKLRPGTSMRQLEMLADVPEKTVSRSLPNGDLRLSHAFRIARALNVTVDWLFDDSQPYPPPSSVTDRQRADLLAQTAEHALRLARLELELQRLTGQHTG